MAYRIIRIDAFRRHISVLQLNEDNEDFARTMTKLTKAKALGHHKICDVDGDPMYACGDAQAEDGTPGFRFRGCQPVTAGIGVLFGQGIKGGLIGCPADRQWVDQHIQWMTAEEVDADEAARIAEGEHGDGHESNG